MSRVVLLLSVVGAFTPAAVGLKTENPVVETITITRPLQEFCSSGRCTYSVPSAFLKHLKNEHCEAAWHAPEVGSLANPSQPTSLQYPAVEVKPESLVTKKHIDGLWIDIRCLDTNFIRHQYQAVFRATNTVPSTMSAQPRNQAVSCIMLSAGETILVVLAILVLCVI